MAQTQYRNMDKGCEGILPRGKGLQNSQKLRKEVTIYRSRKLILSIKSLKKVPVKRKSFGKRYLTEKVALQTYFL